ncbi:MAG: glycosyltransferase [Verrucomicrobia bacterium]|nr:glycosyltransferase [Verrucomicrobiota bacterium]
MILNGIMAALALLSLALTLWQWLAARRFPLHRRATDVSFAPGVTVLKPLKGCDEFTESCLRSWFAQKYAGEMQIILAVADADDPVCSVVEKLRREFPQCDSQLVICPERLGANAKVSKLAQIEPRAKHEIIIVSDADVRVPEDFLASAVAPLRDEKVGLVNGFYRLANPTTVAMQWEAVAINADFWSQVLQSKSLKPLDFALGAVMVTRRKQLAEIGGFRVLEDCLADDYQLGHRIAKHGHCIELCPIVVDCWSSTMYFLDVWSHQSRWARTIRVCQPGPYFASILSNGTIWPLLLYLLFPNILSEYFLAFCLVTRAIMVADLQRRLARKPFSLPDGLLAPLKDLLQVLLWISAFLGNTVVWRGEKYKIRRDGTMVRR